MYAPPDSTDHHCPACGNKMILASRLPEVGSVPELQTYRCGVCSTAVTLEVGKFAKKYEGKTPLKRD
jgi:DNA-directed RNA polymerase subunit RPC12/RpoP